MVDPAPSLVGTKYTEPEFVQAFEGLTFPLEHFHHREHVCLAWLYLQQGETEWAAARMAEIVRRFAAFHGKAEKFHATLTYAWVRLVGAARSRSARLPFSGFLATNPELLDQQLPNRYYSRELMNSQEARGSLVEPDLAALA